ncbi:MAG: polysaccharide biosynthesis tyrosine autokinase [Rhizobiales bacterium]|nr:polysaccharide biosynthesis tyrosine autokinase [Hyphomicrobiales bacterium]
MNTVKKRKPNEHLDAASAQSEIIARDHLELRVLLSTLTREKWLVFGPLIFAMVGLGIYFSIAPRYYSATAQILIDIQKPRIIRSEAVVPSLDTTRYMIDPVIDSQVEIIRSNRIAERVIKRAKLSEDPDYQPKTTFLGSIRALPDRLFGGGAPETSDASSQKDAENVLQSTIIAAFLRNLDVRRKGLTLILFVHFTDKRPARAAEIANAVVEAYLDDQREQKFKSARLANDLLQARVAELRDQVLAAEVKLQQYREKNNLITIGDRTVDEQEITASITQLIAARTNAANKLAELQQIEKMPKGSVDFNSISQVLNSGVIRDLRLQESAIMRTLASTASKFGENDNRVEISRAELRNLQKDISDEITRIIENAQHDFDVAQAQVRILEKNLAQLRKNSTLGSRLSIELAELEREAKSTRDLYLNLLSRLKETLVQESLLYPDARVVERAVKPRIPSSPKKFMLLGFALMGSLGIGVTVALVKDHLSNVVRTPRELEKLLGTVHVTPLPMVQKREPALYKVAVDQPDSQFAQAIFSISRSLWPRRNTSRSKCVVAVTSVLDGEGKTTTAMNLANYSATLNTPTLLIDCDFRTSGMSAYFPASKEQLTLADLLQGKATTNEVIEQIGESDLHICRAPKPGSVMHPMELLSSDQMQQFIKRLRRKYQLIILDTSALLPSVDARALIDFADSCVFVVEAGETTEEQVLQARRVAGKLADKTAMVVLNKSEMEY